MVSCLIEKDTHCHKELTVVFYSKDSVTGHFRLERS